MTAPIASHHLPPPPLIQRQPQRQHVNLDGHIVPLNVAGATCLNPMANALVHLVKQITDLNAWPLHLLRPLRHHPQLPPVSQGGSTARLNAVEATCQNRTGNAAAPVVWWMMVQSAGNLHSQHAKPAGAIALPSVAETTCPSPTVNVLVPAVRSTMV